MSAPALATTEGEQAIARACAILTEDRGFASAAEQQSFRDTMWRLQEAGDRISLATLKATLGEIERRAEDRRNASNAARVAAFHEKEAQHDRERPQRWAALSQMERAAYIVADQVERQNRNPSLGPVDLGKVLVRFAALAGDPGTADRAVPDLFEAKP
jgi:hypothetical protein